MNDNHKNNKKEGDVMSKNIENKQGKPVLPTQKQMLAELKPAFAEAIQVWARRIIYYTESYKISTNADDKNTIFALLSDSSSNPLIRSMCALTKNFKEYDAIKTALETPIATFKRKLIQFKQFEEGKGSEAADCFKSATSEKKLEIINNLQWVTVNLHLLIMTYKSSTDDVSPLNFDKMTLTDRSNFVLEAYKEIKDQKLNTDHEKTHIVPEKKWLKNVQNKNKVSQAEIRAAYIKKLCEDFNNKSAIETIVNNVKIPLVSQTDKPTENRVAAPEKPYKKQNKFFIFTRCITTTDTKSEDSEAVTLRRKR